MRRCLSGTDPKPPATRSSPARLVAAWSPSIGAEKLVERRDKVNKGPKRLYCKWNECHLESDRHDEEDDGKMKENDEMMAR